MLRRNWSSNRSLPNFVVERRVFAEPDIHAAVDLRRAQFMFLEPEGEDSVDTSLVIIGDARAHALGKRFY
jgi:hypothetical protein